MAMLLTIEVVEESHFASSASMTYFQDWFLDWSGGIMVWTIEPSATGQGMTDE
jgi:hypothetical protein